MTIPDKILELIDRFERNKDDYHSLNYKEAQLRKEFIDPFFKALGWDVDNEQGYAEAYKEVVQEVSLQIGESVKAPDYSFRIGGQRKFFLEAKKPKVDIYRDINPAFQLRRYAWSAKLPLSILTDFEEFAVYDCRIKPNKNDKASEARIQYIKYQQYADRWDEIASIFHRDAILKGSFDRYAESARKKKGTTEVDDAFLEEIESWRESLARHIILKNPALTVRQLNHSVQLTIDRIIFLRICEDRGIEPYGRLKDLSSDGGIYAKLVKLFQNADDRYNSGLFHFNPERNRPEPDTLTPKLKLDDKTLKDILGRLYYPESPYEFSMIPADILGQVYERFLGKVIRLTTGGRAKIEDKPEVRKAGGVYYTPTYIVDYIVKHTVGRLLEGMTLSKASELRILDPACGSGSFLLGAYQYLLNWHLDYYINNEPEKFARRRNPPIYKTNGNGWKLTTAERKRILLNNIYGVDIDTQAVEVTKLSLLLKVLEDESLESIDNQMRLLHERALPDLSNNIKCGNSLIGPDFYENVQMTFLDDEEQYRINAFDWRKEFPEIFKRKSPGFDAVIGNPPWGAGFSERELAYLRSKNQEIIVRMIDSFMYFVYQGCDKLKKKGYFGMIIPDVIMYQLDNRKLRDFILNRFKIHNILNMGDVFHKVTRPACILVAEHVSTHNRNILIGDFTQYSRSEKAKAVYDKTFFDKVSQKSLTNLPGHLFITTDPIRYNIWSKIKSVPHILLRDLIDEDGIQRGVSPDLKQAFLVDSKVARNWGLEREKLRRVLTGGKHVKRYLINPPDLWLIYTKRTDDFTELPRIKAYIDQFKDEVTCKEVQEKKHPLYSLHRPRDERIFLKPDKIIGVITEDQIIVSLDTSKLFATDGLYLFGVKKSVEPKYVIGVLNSRLFVFVYRLIALESGRVLAQVKPTILNELPIRELLFSNNYDKLYHDNMVKLVDLMLKLKRRLYEKGKSPQEQTVIQRQIDSTDQAIDKLVYELYGLTDEEIKIVEATNF